MFDRLWSGRRPRNKGHVRACSDAGDSRVLGSQGSLTHETRDVERAREDIAQVLGLGAVGRAEPGRAFEVAPGLVGVAAFGVAETTDA